MSGRDRDLMINALDLEDWALLRDLRREALAEAPLALCPVPGEEHWSQADWQRTIALGLWAVARDGTEVVGLARLVHPEHEPPHIESVWTQPTHRKTGVATALTRWLVAIAARQGHDDVRVWVFAANEVARRLYLGLGFQLTGERQPCHGALDRIEERLRLRAA